MRIAFEASSITNHNPTGIANYARALLNELVLLDSSEHHFTLLNKLSRWKKKQKMYRHPDLQARYYLPYTSLFKGRFDLIHALDAYIPPWPGAKKVTTIHDLFVLINQDPEFFPAAFVKRKQKSYQDIVKRSDAIITVSQSTKDDVIEYLGYPEEKIFVTHLGVDSEFYPRTEEETRGIKQKYDLSDQFLLFVGNVTPRKNTQRIVEAFHASGLYRDLQLVLCGAQNYNSEKTLASIKKLKLDQHVRLLNYVDKADLPALYSAATGFVYPTLYEGFGIPPIEAMACATPVLTGNTGAAPEVCGDDAILVDSCNIEAIADGMQQLLKKTEQDINRAKERVASYTWAQCAKQSISAYQQALG